MDRQICSVERVYNGFVVKCRDGDEMYNINVYQDRWETGMDADEPKLMSMQEVFQDMLSFFGIYNSDHDRLALDVSVVDRKDFPVTDTLEDLKRDLKTLRDAEREESTKDNFLSEYKGK